MSLIEEALRRIKEPLLSPTTSPPQSSTIEAPASSSATTTAHSWPTTSPVATPSATPPSVSATSTNAWLAVTMAVLVLTVALVVSGALWIRQTMGRPTAAAPSQDIQPAEGEPGAVVQAPNSTVASIVQGRQSSVPADLVLSGVVEGVGESYAVINGLIVGIGDRVEGLELTEIANGSVTLRRSDGQELTLRVPR